MIFVQPITSSPPKSNVNLSSLGCHISNGVWLALTYNMLLFLFNNNARCDSAPTLRPGLLDAQREMPEHRVEFAFWDDIFVSTSLRLY